MAICADYSAMIQLYLDDELTGSDLQELLAHLEICASCQRELEDLRTLSRRIKEARPRVAAPVSLRKRILEQAARQDPPRKEAPAEEPIATPQAKKPAGIRSISRGPWLPMLIAAMLCLVSGASLSIPHLRRNMNAQRFVNTAIVVHRGLVDASMPLDVKSDSSQVVASWFASRLPFTFRMPEDGIASPDTANYVLEGGRLVTFGGEKAALLAFRTPNDTASVLIASAKKAQAVGGTVSYSSGITFHNADSNDLHVVTWENKQLVYALIFSNKNAHHSTCSTCHEGAAPSPTAMLNEAR
jgi:anti-sigma factor RsiW